MMQMRALLSELQSNLRADHLCPGNLRLSAFRYIGVCTHVFINSGQMQKKKGMELTFHTCLQTYLFNSCAVGWSEARRTLPIDLLLRKAEEFHRSIKRGTFVSPPSPVLISLLEGFM